MQVLYARCAAVDIGKDVIAVAVRVPGGGQDGRQTIKRTFKTFYGVLAEAARWLVSLGVCLHALIEHGHFERVLVCNAAHVRNVPGRKTDLVDAEWLVHLLECGLLRGSFIPPADIKAARDVIRYRTKVQQQRTAELQRLGGVLQDAGIKIDSVASSIATKSGRAMIEALIDCERRPRVLADLAKGSAGRRCKRRHGSQQLQPVMVEAAPGRRPPPGLPAVPLPPARHEMGRVPQRRREEQGHHRRRARDARHHLDRPGRRHPYYELGAGYFTRRLDPDRETRRLVARLEALGHHVSLQPAA